MLKNLTIIPLNYYMYTDTTILTNPPWWLIPPAWSLGTELQAYLLLPLIFLSRKLLYGLFVLSFGIYMAANLSYLHPDYFGYRLIPGVFFIFITGALLQKRFIRERNFLYLFYGVLLLCFGAFWLTQSFSPAYTRETLLGLLVGIPLIYFFATLKKRPPLSTLAGDYSYTLFLSHFFSLWILEYFGLLPNNSFFYITLLTLCSLCLAYIGVNLVQNHINKLRFVRK
jgi:peptidoglycan/LPS O-acetylase OafA/YrhL